MRVNPHIFSTLIFPIWTLKRFGYKDFDFWTIWHLLKRFLIFFCNISPFSWKNLLLQRFQAVVPISRYRGRCSKRFWNRSSKIGIFVTRVRLKNYSSVSICLQSKIVNKQFEISLKAVVIGRGWQVSLEYLGGWGQSVATSPLFQFSSNPSFPR